MCDIWRFLFDNYFDFLSLSWIGWGHSSRHSSLLRSQRGGGSPVEERRPDRSPRLLCMYLIWCMHICLLIFLPILENTRRKKISYIRMTAWCIFYTCQTDYRTSNIIKFLCCSCVLDHRTIEIQEEAHTECNNVHADIDTFVHRYTFIHVPRNIQAYIFMHICSSFYPFVPDRG